MSQKGIRDWLKAYIPKWLSNRPGLNNGFKILYGMAVQADMLLDLAIEAVGSWWPGYALGATNQALDASSAIPLLGLSRGILQGEAETQAAYAVRLQAWRETWANAGSSEVLAEEIQAYLGNTPTVRIVDRSGNWVTRAPDGTVSKVVAPWNWDSVSNPERAQWWSDLWIIVYPCEWPITGTTLASLVGVWGTYNGGGTGHGVPRAAVDAILSLVETFKGAHCWCQAILFSYDATLFVPGTTVSGDPDGTWGNFSRNVGGVQVPARLADGRVRFWIPNGG
jgi:hypothetical protein